MSGATVERVSTESQSASKKSSPIEQVEKTEVSCDGTGKWKAQIYSNYAALEPLWRRMETEGACTVFQTYDWVSCWYDTAVAAGEAEPLVVTVHRGEGEPLWLLPLCVYDKGKLRIISFADLGISDYAGPVMGRKAPTDRFSVKAMMKAVLEALPPCDAVHFQKFGENLEDGVPNPLAAIKGAERFIADCHGIRLTEPWPELAGKIMQPRLRSTIKRKKKKLKEQGEVSVERYAAPEELGPALERLMVMRSKRYDSIGRPDFAPVWRDFYHKLATSKKRKLHVSIETLKISGEEIATCFGLRRGKSYHALLPTFQIGKWEPYRPGMLLFDAMLTELSKKALAEDACGYFDFTVGDEIYKKRFGSESNPLYEWVTPRSAAGYAYFLVWRTKVFLRHYPQLVVLLKNIIGRINGAKDSLKKTLGKTVEMFGAVEKSS